MILTFDGPQDGRAVLGAHSVGIAGLEAAAGRGTVGLLAYEQRVVIVEHIENWMHTVDDILVLGCDPRRGRTRGALRNWLTCDGVKLLLVAGVGRLQMLMLHWWHRLVCHWNG